MDKQPLVSIGLPVFNGEKYLELAINSIINQTHENFELIISDNCSVDRTQEICHTYTSQDNRIKYYRNYRNLGAAPNFNKVFRLSSGKYFKWAAYDDLLAKTFLSQCVEILENYSDVVLCFPKSMIIDENGNHMGIHIFKKNVDSNHPHTRFRDIVLFPDTAFQVFGLTRTSILTQTGLIGSFPASDIVLLAELALHGRFYEISEALFYPRYHSNQSIRGPYTVERERVSWFDTSVKYQLPKWEYLLGFIRAINRKPIPIFQRMFCYCMVLRWAFIPAHFRALGKDIVLTFLKLARDMKFSK